MAIKEYLQHRLNIMISDLIKVYFLANIYELKNRKGGSKRNQSTFVPFMYIHLTYMNSVTIHLIMIKF